MLAYGSAYQLLVLHAVTPNAHRNLGQIDATCSGKSGFEAQNPHAICVFEGWIERGICRDHWDLYRFEIPDAHCFRDSERRLEFLDAVSVDVLDRMFRPFEAGIADTFYVADDATDRIITAKLVENANCSSCPVSWGGFMPGGSPAIGLDASMVGPETVYLVETMERVFFAHAHDESLQVNLMLRHSGPRGFGRARRKLVGKENELPRGCPIECDADLLLNRGILEIREPEGAQSNRPIVVEFVGSL